MRHSCRRFSEVTKHNSRLLFSYPFEPFGVRFGVRRCSRKTTHFVDALRCLRKAFTRNWLRAGKGVYRRQLQGPRAARATLSGARRNGLLQKRPQGCAPRGRPQTAHNAGRNNAGLTKRSKNSIPTALTAGAVRWPPCRRARGGGFSKRGHQRFFGRPSTLG